MVFNIYKSKKFCNSTNLIIKLNFFFFLFNLSQIQKRPYMHTHVRKKKRKRNINPKRCTIEKYKFKTKFAQNIGNKTIYTINVLL